MKALVYLGPCKKAVEERPKPVIDAATDAIVRISKTTICGTDLHILKGDVATCQPGRVLGHEGTGVIDEVGEGAAFSVGDEVLGKFHFTLLRGSYAAQSAGRCGAPGAAALFHPRRRY